MGLIVCSEWLLERFLGIARVLGVFRVFLCIVVFMVLLRYL